MIDSKVNPDRPLIIRGQRLSGNAAVSGVAHVIRNEAELDKFREGEILVATDIPETWSHLFALAKAIVTETDNCSAHVAEASRTFDIPVVTGVLNVTTDLRSGDLVMMHIDGAIERLQDRRAPDSEMRVSVPAAVHARQFASGVGHDAGNGASVVVLPVTRSAQPADAQNQNDLQDDDKPRKQC